MNKILQIYARNYLKYNLNNCTKEQQLLFKKMYSFNNLSCDINKVVDKMDESALDWAMMQVERTIDKQK